MAPARLRITALALTALLAIARVLAAFSRSRRNSFRGVVFIANVGEEGEGNLKSGMRYLCRQSATGSRIRSFLILDGPNTDHITSQALASRRFDVTITGPGGHRLERLWDRQSGARFSRARNLVLY